MKEIVKFIDNLPLWLKIIFALPIIDGIVYGIYRIAKGHPVAGIIWFFIGAIIGWILDIICIVTHGKVTFYA